MKVKISKDEIWLKLGIFAVSSPEFIEVDAEPIMKEKCPCSDLQNGDIIHVDNEGKCIVCRTQRATPQRSVSLKDHFNKLDKELEKERPKIGKLMPVWSYHEELSQHCKNIDYKCHLENLERKVNEIIEAINNIRHEK